MQTHQRSLFALGLCALFGLLIGLIPSTAAAGVIEVNTGNGTIYISQSQGGGLSATGKADGSAVTSIDGSGGSINIAGGYINIAGMIEFMTADGQTGFLTQNGMNPDGSPAGYQISWLSNRPTQNVTVGVPEISTWAMLLVGFTGIGFMTHRRRRNGAVFMLRSFDGAWKEARRMTLHLALLSGVDRGSGDARC